MQTISGNILTPSGFVQGSASCTPAGRIAHITGAPVSEEQARDSGLPLPPKGQTIHHPVASLGCDLTLEIPLL